MRKTFTINTPSVTGNKVMNIPRVKHKHFGDNKSKCGEKNYFICIVCDKVFFRR